jgi:hypothetical protein
MAFCSILAGAIVKMGFVEATPISVDMYLGWAAPPCRWAWGPRRHPAKHCSAAALQRRGRSGSRAAQL